MRTRQNPQFGSNEKALAHFIQEYTELTEAYGLKDDEFWLEAESASYLTEDHVTIMRLARSIHMCKYLIAKSREIPEMGAIEDNT